MTQTEILEFLELPASATEKEIEERVADKFLYFTRLKDSAPNDFLRKLHVKNIEKLKEIQQLYNLPQTPRNSYSSVATPKPGTGPGNNSKGGAGKKPAALLIRHTENLSTKTYEIQPGANYIGRSSQPGQYTILVEDDPYVSRTHAVLYAEQSGSGYSFYIVDSPQANGGKASKNGTYINGDSDRINRKTLLYADDTVQVGTTKFILKLSNNAVKNIINEVEEADYVKTVVVNIY